MSIIKKHGRKLIVGAGLLGATFAAAPPAKTTHAPKCNGTERWMVKTLQDETAGQIKLRSSKLISIEELIAIPRSSEWTEANNSPRLADEFKVYTTRGKIIYAKPQADGDIHIELSDGKNPEHTVIAEIPNPNCSNVKNSDFVDIFRKTKNDWVNKYQDKTVYSKGTFEVRGVLFHDAKNHGNGGNENGVELHPVLSIKKLK